MSRADHTRAVRVVLLFTLAAPGCFLDWAKFQGGGDGGPQSMGAGVEPNVTLGHSGPVRATQAGATIEKLDVEGCVLVDANDVTLRNLRIHGPCDPAAIQIAEGRTGTVIEHVEIDGAGNTYVGIGSAHYHASYVDVHDCERGFRAYDEVVIDHAYVHHLRGTIPVGVVGEARNVTVRDSFIDGSDAIPAVEAAIGIGGGTNAVGPVRIDGNRLSGGGYTLSIGGAEAAFTVINNRFVRSPRDGSAYGPAMVEPVGSLTWENNVYDDNNERVSP